MLFRLLLLNGIDQGAALLGATFPENDIPSLTCRIIAKTKYFIMPKKDCNFLS